MMASRLCGSSSNAEDQDEARKGTVQYAKRYPWSSLGTLLSSSVRLALVSCHGKANHSETGWRALVLFPSLFFLEPVTGTSPGPGPECLARGGGIKGGGEGTNQKTRRNGGGDSRWQHTVRHEKYRGRAWAIACLHEARARNNKDGEARIE